MLCHGVLMYLDEPASMIDSLTRRLAPGGVLSVMALNRETMAVRPALERRWADALAAFDAGSEIGVLGTPTRADTVEELSGSLRAGGLEPQAWYGVWLFTDWMDLPAEGSDVTAIAEVEFEASVRDPYRRLSRAFHLVARDTVTS